MGMANLDGTALEDWASACGVHLLFDHKEPVSFHSVRWNTTTNPDLAFVNLNGPSLHCVVFDRFPKSQHRPSLITPHNPSETIATKPVKRWNFHKAYWDLFKGLTDTEASNLPEPTSTNLDQPYTAFCNLLVRAAKNSIPHGFCRR